jgi:hypothetical protein
MQPIEKPQLLDPDRVVDPNRNDMTVDHESASKELRGALEATAEYGEQLWDHLTAVRQYLLESLPPDPRAAGPHTQLGARPTGPDDEEGWQRWVDIYASVTSVLAGAHGDSGFGLREASDAARIRTDAPNAQLAKRIQAEYGGGKDNSQNADSGGSGSPDPGTIATRSMVRSGGLAVLALLALRGLRPRR